MSYEVTATRRRPQKFEELVGQEFVAETFRNSIRLNKIAHAYLFSGPRGCGKTSTARILAKALNCAEGPTAEPCGKCQQCIEITKGACTDVIEIDGASNTSVNDVRQIKDEVLFPPQSCRYKIYIIDEVHMLSTSAFNALLKTIEEPPPYVIFIFATTELQKVPATIKSRCQQFNFRLVPIEKVKEQLSLAAKEIGIEAEDEALYWIARESTGSMRDAYTLFDQVAAFSGDKITYEKIRDKLGLVGVERLNEIFDFCADGENQKALEKLDEFLQAGISIEQLISNCTDYLRSLLLIKNGITKESLLGQSAGRYSENVLAKWNPVQLERGLSIFLQLYRDMRYSLSPRYELELAFSRLSWLSQYVSPAEVKIAVDKARNLLEKDILDNAGTPQNHSFSNGGAEPPEQTGAQKIAQNTQIKANFPHFAFTSKLTKFLEEEAAKNAVSGTDSAQDVNTAHSVTASEKENFTSSVNISHGEVHENDYGTYGDSDFPPVSETTNEEYSPWQEDYSEYPADASAQDVNFTSEVNSASGVNEMPGANFSPSVNTAQGAEGSVLPSENSFGAGEYSGDELKKSVLKELVVSDAVVGTLLMQTDDWIIEGDTIKTSVLSMYTQNQIQANMAKISAVIQSIFGRPLKLDASLKKVEQSNAEINTPPSIKIVCRLFKGELVGYSEKTEMNFTGQEQQPEVLTESGSEYDEGDDD